MAWPQPKLLIMDPLSQLQTGKQSISKNMTKTNLLVSCGDNKLNYSMSCTVNAFVNVKFLEFGNVSGYLAC